jgi:excisionase family DNA binding protein
MSDERWLTVAQVADVVQVHPETVREWLRVGKLPGTLLSRRAGWRVREGDVQRFLAGGLGAPEGKALAA